MATKATKANKGDTMDDAWAKKFEELAPVRPEIHYYRPEIDGEAVPICGILLERREWTNQEGETSKNFVFALTLPCRLFSAGNPEPSEYQAGSFAFVKEWAQLRDLNRYLPTVGANGYESVTEILIVPKAIEKRNGKPMRRFEVRARRLGANDSPVGLLAAPTAQPVRMLEEASDEIPF